MTQNAWDAATMQFGVTEISARLFDGAPEAMLATDGAGRIVAANTAAARLLGYSRLELGSLRLAQILNAAPRTGQLVAWRKDGVELPVDVNSGPADETGISVLIVRDDTARRLAGAAFEETCRRITGMLESMTEPVFALDDHWRYIYLNPKAAQLMGRRRDDLLGRNIWDEFPDLLNSVFYQEYHRAAAERRPIEFSAFDAERQLWVQVHVCPYEQGLSILFRDLAAQSSFDTAGGDSQRMEALGRLAGGVAHDFNNLLTIIGGYGRMLLDSMDQKNPLRKDVDPIVEAAVRASALTRQLLTFSRRQFVQPRVIDLNRLIGKMNKMLRRVIGEDVELRLSLRSDLGRTSADPGQLEQVIMNLAVNARDAMPTGGKISIATDNVEIGPGIPGLAPASYVTLTISDTGRGMDEETRSHAFEPFFTTKAKGKGTGLGLATVYGIIKQAGGEVRVESSPGSGASFRIYLPRTRKVPKAHRAVAVRRPRKGTETILLVEDEPDVRRLTGEMLRRLGYHVWEASDGPEALSLWSTLSTSVDLLVTDVVMPQMSGPELAERLVASRPGLKVLYISGYTDETVARHGITRDATLLPKPFTSEALGLTVRSVLDSASATAAAH